jgi:hypothetical protein
MEESTIAYAAGLVDGEGSILLSRNHKQDRFRCPCVSITSTTPELLMFMKENFGGVLCTRKRQVRRHHKKAQVWHLQYDAALRFLVLILPFLREPSKKTRATMLVDNHKTLTPRNGRYTIEQIARKLEFEERFLSV